MKAKDLRERSVEDLAELEKSLATDTLPGTAFKNFTNRLDDTSAINKTKRDLARVKTILASGGANAALRPRRSKRSCAKAEEEGRHEAKSEAK